ncbi:HU family DNA-binding protein [Mycoplasma leachii]|uniref:HU family DNA-binding protein n=1 Tax=Mycoplasma leachii TaxID=2105 RepID=UPI003DA5AAC1
MKKMDFIRNVKDNLDTNYTNTELCQIYDTIVNSIKLQIAENGVFKINGLGKFVLKTVPESQGFNSITREPLTIPKYKTIKFKIFKSFKKELN